MNKSNATDPRVRRSKLSQLIASIFKSDPETKEQVTEVMNHDTQHAKRATHTGTARDSVSSDVWHENKVPSEGSLPTGRAAGATGGDASEFSDEYRDDAEQRGGSRQAEELSRRLDRLENLTKALLVALGKSAGYDIDAAAFDDDKEENEEEEDGETSKSMPSTDIAGLLSAVAGRRDGQGFRTPPHFAKARGNAFDEISRQIDELPLAKGLAATSLLNAARCVAEGSLPEHVFAHHLSEAEPEIRNMFSQFDRDPSVRKWIF